MITPRGRKVRKRKVALEINEIIRSMPKRARVDCSAKRILETVETSALTPCTTVEDTQSETCFDVSVSLMIYTNIVLYVPLITSI